MNKRMMSYLPAFLGKTEIFTEIINSEAIELEELLSSLKDLEKQYYVETATWGLDVYEKELGLTAGGELQLEERRARILVKLKSVGKISSEMLRSTIESHGGFDIDISLDETINFTFQYGDKINLHAIESDIDEIKPAHLGHAIAIKLKTICSMGSGATTCKFDYRKTNTLRAGTHSSQSLLGIRSLDNVEASTSLIGSVFRYDYAGTKPFRSKIGSKLGAGISSSLEIGLLFIGYRISGTHPTWATKGVREDSRFILGAEREYSVFDYKASSDTNFTGLYPDKSKVAYKMDEEKRISSEMEMITFSYALCGTKKSGES